MPLKRSSPLDRLLAARAQQRQRRQQQPLTSPPAAPPAPAAGEDSARGAAPRALHVLDGYLLLRLSGVALPEEACRAIVSHQNPPLNSVDASHLREFTSLVRLDAAGNALNLEWFAALPALLDLNLACNGIRKIALQAAGEKSGESESQPPFRSLLTLSLSHNRLCDLAAALRELSALPRLRDLDIAHNGAALTALGTAPIAGFAALRRLSLAGNAWPSGPADSHAAFASLGALPALQELDLSETGIRDLPEVAGFAFPKLRVLSLARNAFENEEALLGLASLPALEIVDVSGSPLALDAAKRWSPRALPLLRARVARESGVRVVVAGATASEDARVLEPSESEGESEVDGADDEAKTLFEDGGEDAKAATNRERRGVDGVRVLKWRQDGEVASRDMNEDDAAVSIALDAGTARSQVGPLGAMLAPASSITAEQQDAATTTTWPEIVPDCHLPSWLARDVVTLPESEAAGAGRARKREQAFHFQVTTLAEHKALLAMLSKAQPGSRAQRRAAELAQPPSSKVLLALENSRLVQERRAGERARAAGARDLEPERARARRHGLALGKAGGAAAPQPQAPHAPPRVAAARRGSGAAALDDEAALDARLHAQAQAVRERQRQAALDRDVAALVSTVTRHFAQRAVSRASSRNSTGAASSLGSRPPSRAVAAAVETEAGPTTM